jgi:hypothetical protein
MQTLNASADLGVLMTLKVKTELYVTPETSAHMQIALPPKLRRLYDSD